MTDNRTAATLTTAAKNIYHVLLSSGTQNSSSLVKMLLPRSRSGVYHRTLSVNRLAMEFNHLDSHLFLQEQSHGLPARFNFSVVTFSNRTDFGNDVRLFA